MPFRPCVSGCGRYLAPGDGHDRCLSCLGIEHAEAAFVDESCPHCGGMTVAGLRTRLRFLQRGGVPVPLPRSRVPPGGYQGEATSGSSRAGLTVTVRNSPPKTARAPPVTGTSLPMELPRERAGPSHGGGVQLVSFGAPPDDRMSIATSEGESDQSGNYGSVPLPPSGRSAVPDSDPEMVAMLARAAESAGLEWRPPPCPEPSRLDDWFLWVARAVSQGPTPVPFFPEVHDELTGTWMAPFTARNRSSGSSSLATLDGGAARGYTEVPPVERSVAMQLCPRTASTWRGNPLLPSPACRHSSALTGSAYAACGEAASALHAMVLLQVHQAKALRDLHEGGHDPGVLSELRTATDLALRATKVTTQSLGRAMSTMVVQERHLWLCLADMKEVDKARFLNALVSQTGLFGGAVENFAQQFSAAQKQTEAIRHILPRRAAAASTRPPAAVPRSTRRRGRPPAAAPAPAQQTQQPPAKQRRGASRRAAAPPGRPSVYDPVCMTDDPGMEMFALREMVNAPLPPPEEGQAENLLFPFLPLASRSVVPKTSTKEQFPLSLGPQRGRGVVNESNLSYTHPPLSPVGSCGRFERAVNRTTHAPSAGTQVSASHMPTPLRTGNETPEPGPCVPPRCPTAGTSVGSLVSLVRFWGAWLALPNPSRWLLRTIRLGYAIQFARRPPKYRGIHSTTVRAADAPILRAEIAVLLAKDAIEPVPPADMRSGFYSPYFIVPKKSGGLRPILDLRILNRALHRLPFKMLTPNSSLGASVPRIGLQFST